MELPTNGWKNKNGTSERSCKCTSWKNHWISQTGQKWPDKCFVEGCNSEPILGAHIINTSKEINSEYIAPFCDKCNKQNGEFKLKGGKTLALANKQETCAK